MPAAFSGKWYLFLGITNGALMPDVRHLHMEMLLLLC